MKRWICVVLAALFCSVALAEEEQAIGAKKLDLDEIYKLDLDGDGTEETVQVRKQSVDEEDSLQLLVETDELVYTFDTYIQFDERAYAADLDGDGAMEILLCGDEASADYSTWCLRFDREKGLQSIPFADANRGENTGKYFDWGYGRIDAVEGNRLTLSGSQDALGTWWCSRQFTLRDGRFELDDDGVWHVVEDLDDADNWEYRSLKLVRDLDVKLEDGAPTTLHAGTRFLITETDKTSYVGFVTEDGIRGTISIAPDLEEGWGYQIDGINEGEYFDILPYAD